VTRDGERFIMQRYADAGSPTPMIVVLNFFEELKQRVPN
jgi:hypothetical protein